MNRTLMQSTQIKITLSVNLECKTPIGDELVTLSLLSLTWLFMLIWQVQLFINRLRYEIKMIWQDLIDTTVPIGKVFAIGFNSLAFGLGVTL